MIISKVAHNQFLMKESGSNPNKDGPGIRRRFSEKAGSGRSR